MTILAVIVVAIFAGAIYGLLLTVFALRMSRRILEDESPKSTESKERRRV